MYRETDEEIVQRVLTGDYNDFERLVNRYSKNVYNIALRMVRSPEDAEDLSQEAFLKAYRSLSSFRGDSKFSVWLYRIVSNVCLDHIRKKKKENEVSLSVEDDDGEETELEISDISLSPESLLEKKLTVESVRNGLDSLPEDSRRILLLREIQGLSYDEISGVLDLDPGTVKSRISRARKKLCAFLIADGNISDRFTSNTSEGGVRQ